nr:non-structural polyprotein [Chicken astrovirus]QOJ44190.1 non-structural polyprotein [Chicken astrovirus]QOJ44193.1 non-structural polyprotein [Chicken astrovirus]
MAQAMVGAFSSLNRREDRKSAQVTTGLDKVFSFQGVHELFVRMRALYGMTTAWKALMDCEAVYIKDVKTAFGANGSQIGFFFAETPTTPTWSPDAGIAILTEGEKTCLAAQQARDLRLKASLSTNSSLVHQIMEKTREAKEKTKQLEELQHRIDNMVDTNKVLYKRMEQRHQEKLEALGEKVSKLRHDNHQWFMTCEKKDEEIAKLKHQLEVKKNGYKKMAWDAVAWLMLAILLFSFFSVSEGAIPNGTPPIKEVSWNFDDVEKTCMKPDFGCLVMDTWLPHPVLTFEDLMSKCYNTHGNVIPRSAFNSEQLLYDCTKTAHYFNDGHDYIENYHWCEKRLATLVAANCQGDNGVDKIYTQVVEAVAASRKFFQKMALYKLDVWILAIFSIVLAGNKEKIVKLTPFIALGWWFNLPIFLLSTAVNFFPTMALPFIAVQILQPGFLVVTAFTLWLTLTLVAFFWNDGIAILVETSFALLYTILFFVWSMAMTVCASLQLSLAYQILLFCVSLSVYCGTKFACSQVVITNPDGTTEKISRVGKARKAAFQQCKGILTFLQTRGIIPSTPVKTNSVVVITGKNGVGTGFRFMNYIVTAGHVVNGSEWATAKFGDVSVKIKKEKEIDMCECPDTLVLFKLPKELQSVKPLRLAQNIKSNYMTLHGFCPNFVNPVSFTGWCTIDGPWLNNAFNTTFGNSGAPYCDPDGKLVGIHLGTQGVTSQGFVICDTLRKQFETHYQCSCRREECDQQQPAPAPPAQFDYEEFLAKVITGTKISHQAILKQQEEMLEQIQLVTKILKDNGLLAEQKKKGKTKRTARGAKATMTKKYLSKGHFMKMKMLSEEEYQKLVDEGFTADEIKEVVNNLREQAWLEYCIDNDIDDEGAEDWYDQMLNDEAVNDQIDREIEAKMEDEGFYQSKARETLASQCRNKKRKTFVEQALLHIIDLKPHKVRTVKVEVQDESANQLKKVFKRMVKDEEVEQGQTKAFFSSGDDIEYFENRDIDWKKLEMPKLQDEVKFETITRNGITQISTGEDNKKNILKEKVTNIPQPLTPVPPFTENNPDIKPKKEQVLEQRKRVCRSCGSDKPHNFVVCKKKNELLFCVWCGIVHSENQGHSRKIECPKCNKAFSGIEGLERHASECPSKN